MQVEERYFPLEWLRLEPIRDTLVALLGPVHAAPGRRAADDGPRDAGPNDLAAIAIAGLEPTGRVPRLHWAHTGKFA